LDSTFEIDREDSLIIVDVQRDFCPGGALPVPNGDKVVPVLNGYIQIFIKARAKIFATRDWHPPHHISFRGYGGTWPPHCIQGSKGAEFHPDLKLPEDVTIISKAMDPSRESYSGFDATELNDELKKKGIKRIFVGGLATDYCVKNTVLDGLRLGFEVILLSDATRGIDARPGDVAVAIEDMLKKGAKEATLSELSDSLGILQEEKTTEKIEQETLRQTERKRKARLRTRGPYRKAHVES